MKKALYLCIMVFLVLTVLVSCSSNNQENDNNTLESDNADSNNIVEENDITNDSNNQNINNTLNNNIIEENETILPEEEKSLMQIFIEEIMLEYDTDQVIVSYQNDNETKYKGIVFGYEKNYNTKISKTLDVMNVVMGKEGVNKEKEGDMKSPSGVYKIPYAFGYVEENEKSDEEISTENMDNTNDNKKSVMEEISFTFIETTPNDYWVDDVDSEDYNDWKTLSTQNPDEVWNSYEKLYIPSYRFAFLIDYNSEDEKGKGSAIFFHVWKDGDTYTSGCTATSEENIIEILKWLDEYKNPVIVQGDYEYFKNEHGIDLEEVNYE